MPVAPITFATGRLPSAMASGPVKEWTRFLLRKAMQKASVIVAPVYELDEFDLEELAGKTIITSTVSDERLAQLRDKGVHMVIDGAPLMHGHAMGPDLLDAMIFSGDRQSTQRSSGRRLPGDHHRA
jgi:hypothetical protein